MSQVQKNHYEMTIKFKLAPLKVSALSYTRHHLKAFINISDRKKL